ncbi:carboxypeptidase regulatory-like domain-containing protein [Myxococcus sp. K38C18041901]|uniref:MSCRAMM family protein n=1 Tax=Myxococcus guangdongensis TaxID=2906760 RepID=UPI0020A72C2C|nr:carboxypeptidase regulatory-like domain-containing protein [Myxococcus guangdongensis]MCP3063958.1 carboxypeptidase regulatory-like domain-containing protein [Myxococcus guangdongensis]
MKPNRLGALLALVLTVAVLPACGDGDDVTRGGITGEVVLDDGATPEGSEVTLVDTGDTFTLNEDGRFIFEDLKPGTYGLSALVSGYEPMLQEVRVESAQVASAHFALKRIKSKVSGTIQLEGATSHEGITVTLEGTSFTTTTDAAGNFVLEGVPTGAHFLEASKEGYLSALSLVALTSEPETVSLTLQRKPFIAITGVIILQDTTDSSGVRVVLQGTSHIAFTLDSYGGFALVDVAPGVYTLVASKEGYVSKSEEVTVVEGKTAYVVLTLNLATVGTGLTH